jgi:hypothetical protein
MRSFDCNSGVTANLLEQRTGSPHHPHEVIGDRRHSRTQPSSQETPLSWSMAVPRQLMRRDAPTVRPRSMTSFGSRVYRYVFGAKVLPWIGDYLGRATASHSPLKGEAVGAVPGRNEGLAYLCGRSRVADELVDPAVVFGELSKPSVR